MTAIVVILLNWRNSADTLACLAQLQQLDPPRPTIVVVDNGSGDGSAKRIHAGYPDLALIESPVNRGFSGGVNQGLQYAAALNADYALLLNSDVTFAPVLIARLVEAAQADPQTGVLGPKIYQSMAAHRLAFYGFRANYWQIRPVGWHTIDLGQFDHAPIDAIPGCAMLISRAALHRVGLFDERFFFYFEDIDYCLRVAAAGLTVRVVPTAAIEHELGGSTRRNPARRQFLLGASRALFLRKHRRRFNLPLLLIGEAREIVNQMRAAVSLGPAAAFGYLVGLATGLSTPTKEYHP